MAVSRSARRTTARKTTARKAAPAKAAPAKKTAPARKSAAPSFTLSPKDYDAVAEALDTLVSLLAAGDSSSADEDSDDENGEREPLDRDEVAAMSIKELRELADELELGTRVKAEILDALEEGDFYADDDSDEDEDDADEDEDSDDEEGDDEDDDEEEEEEGDYTREELEEMTLAEVRKIARTEYDIEAAELKGLDQDAIIDLILEDEGEDGDEDEDDEEGEEDELTEADLKKMDIGELKDVMKDLKLKVPVKGVTKANLVKLIMEQAE